METQSTGAIIDTIAVQECVLCGRTLGHHHLRLISFSIFRCGSCGSWICFPRPSPLEQAAIHDSPDYFEHPYFRARRNLEVNQSIRCRDLFDFIQEGIDFRIIREERILDVGCDTGSLLAAAKDAYGIIPYGVDVSSRAIQIAQERGIRVHLGTVEDAPSDFRDFPVVTAIDIIEHVANPEAFLRSISTRLRDGGILYVQTPNVECSLYCVGRWLSKLTGARPRSTFTRLFPMQHLQYFTRQALIQLAERCGFCTVKVQVTSLPDRDIVVEEPIRSFFKILQLADSLSGNGTLIRALFRK